MPDLMKIRPVEGTLVHMGNYNEIKTLLRMQSWTNPLYTRGLKKHVTWYTNFEKKSPTCFKACEYCIRKSRHSSRHKPGRRIKKL